MWTLPATWHRGCQRLGRLLLPPRCVVCGEAGSAGLDLCEHCRAGLPWNADGCRRCALPLGEAGQCPRCLHAPLPFECAQVAFRYGFPLDRLLPRFKFHGDLAAGRVLADVWCHRVPASRPHALVPVPLHRARLRERGYDQALELARRVARACDVPVLADAVHRVRATARQSELAAGARRRNVRGAFAVTGTLPIHVALVDDVMTTGATLRAVATALRRAGVGRIEVWVLARAPARLRGGA
jgi:ComF family protein